MCRTIADLEYSLQSPGTSCQATLSRAKNASSLCVGGWACVASGSGMQTAAFTYIHLPTHMLRQCGACVVFKINTNSRLPLHFNNFSMNTLKLFLYRLHLCKSIFVYHSMSV